MPAIRILLVNTNVPRSTKKMVAGVREKRDKVYVLHLFAILNKTQYIFFFLRSFFPEGQDWTESTSGLYLSPLLSGGKIPGEKSLVKNPP